MSKNRGAERLTIQQTMLEIKGQDELIDTLLKCKPLPESDIRSLCAKAKEVLVKESNV